MAVARHTEAHFQTQVLQLAGFYGWDRVYHTHDSRRSHKGWPDLVLCRVPEIMFIELKGQKTRVRPEQKDWLAALTACGLETHLWRPADWDEVKDRLSRGRVRHEPLWEGHPEDPGLDHLHGSMLTPCTVCGHMHSHRCDPPACGRGERAAANQGARPAPQDGENR